jgi:hypothetical protein
MLTWIIHELNNKAERQTETETELRYVLELTNLCTS